MLLKSAFNLIKKDPFVMLLNVMFFLVLGLISSGYDGLFTTFKPENFIPLIGLTLGKDIVKFCTLVMLTTLNDEKKINFRQSFHMCAERFKSFIMPYAVISAASYGILYSAFVTPQSIRNFLHPLLPFLDAQISDVAIQNIEVIVGIICLIPLFCLLEFLPVSTLYVKSKAISSTFAFIMSNKIAIIWYFSLAACIAILGSLFAAIFSLAIPVVGASVLVPIIHAFSVTLTYGVLLFFYQIRRWTVSSLV